MIREALDLVIENIQLYKSFEGFGLQPLFYKEIGRLLLFFGLLVLILALIMGVFMYFMRQTIIVMSRLIEYDMRKEVYDQYQRLDLAFFRKNKTGDLMARITEDVTKVRMYLGPALLYTINLVSLFVVVIYSMFKVNATLSLYTLLPLPFLSISIYYVSNLINTKSSIIQRQLATLNSVSQEVFSGIRVIKSYVQERFFGKNFSDECDDFREKSLALARINAAFFPLMVLMIGTSTILTIYIGGVQVSKGAVTPGNIAEFVIYINMLTWPVTAIGWIASLVQQAEASQERINEFLNQKPEIISGQQALSVLQGKIEFSDVSFRYPDTGIQALRNVSFTLNPGEKMAIVGRTASGKTTIADLILRMFDVSSGEIRIDGIPIDRLQLEDLRQKVGYVPQDIFLFSDTIKSNVSFGVDNTTIEEVKKYAQHAAIHEDIEALPLAYDTKVGERGVTLSGGQKQRISIARALIKNPNIVVLDDCLSAVDTKTEHKILNYLKNDLETKTTIIITHRIHNLLQYDKIIVLEEGQIVEEGNHEELMQLNGYYRQMFERQLVEEGEES